MQQVCCYLRSRSPKSLLHRVSRLPLSHKQTSITQMCFKEDLFLQREFRLYKDTQHNNLETHESCPLPVSTCVILSIHTVRKHWNGGWQCNLISLPVIFFLSQRPRAWDFSLDLCFSPVIFSNHTHLCLNASEVFLAHWELYTTRHYADIAET